MNETNSKNKKGMSLKGQRTLAYIVLIIISFFCLFWFMYCLSMPPDPMAH